MGGGEHGLCAGPGLEADSVLRGQSLVATNHVVHQIGQIGGGERHVETPGIGPRHGQQRLGECGHVFGFHLDGAQRIPVFPRFAVAPQGQLGGGADHRQRRAQLVGCVRGELPDAFHGDLQALQHFIPRLRHPLQLVSRPRHSHALTEILHADRPGDAGDFVHRP